MTVSVGANAPNAERRKIGSHTMEVTSISAESIPDSAFEIPTGYYGDQAMTDTGAVRRHVL
jgi:hypothetical protein